MTKVLCHCLLIEDWDLYCGVTILNSTNRKQRNAPLTKHESSFMKGALHLLHENKFVHSMS